VIRARRARRARSVLALAPLALAGCAADQQIERPTPLYGEVPIEYPSGLWDQDVEGETLLRVRVTETGRVDSVEVVESSGHQAFDSAAIAGARDLRFQPARRNGKRIEVWAQVPVHFSKRPRPGGGGENP
jgi:TonB family protein